MVLDGRAGSTGIRFKPGYEPVKYQFATASAGPWHDTMQTNDKYRRDSLDGGTTWGDPYQFRGTDGRNGSDANVTFDNIKAALQKAASTKTTFITADEIGAPNIYGGSIYGSTIYAGMGADKDTFAKVSSDGFELYFDGINIPKVKIDAGWEGRMPGIRLGSGDGFDRQVFNIYKNQTQAVLSYSGSGTNYCMLVFNDDGSIFPFGSTWLAGTWDFTKATVKGVHATWAD